MAQGAKSLYLLQEFKVDDHVFVQKFGAGECLREGKMSLDEGWRF